MKAILIDPQERSLETIEVIGDETSASLIELRELVDDYLDFCYFMPLALACGRLYLQGLRLQHHQLTR